MCTGESSHVPWQAFPNGLTCKVTLPRQLLLLLLRATPFVCNAGAHLLEVVTWAYLCFENPTMFKKLAGVDVPRSGVESVTGLGVAEAGAQEDGVLVEAAGGRCGNKSGQCEGVVCLWRQRPTTRDSW